MAPKTQSTSNRIATPVDEVEKKCLHQLRNTLKNSTSLSCPMEDEYLLRFLRYRNHDMDRTVKAIETFWRNRQNSPHLHDDLYPSRYEAIYESRFSNILSHRDNQDRQIVIQTIANWDQDTVPLIELLRSDFCVCDTISFRQLTQLKGIVMIMDLSGLSKAMFKACTLSNIRLMISLNDGFPMKIKEIHFINHPSFFGYFYSLAKPFLKKKLVQRTHFHGSDYTSLHKFIEPAILPKKYGGLLENNWEEGGFIKEMLDKDQYFKDLFNPSKFGYQVQQE